MENINLITYLLNNTDYSKDKIKKLLKNKLVLVNDKVETKATTLLTKNDKVRLLKGSSTLPFPIIYEDDNIIAIDKPSGLLTIADDKEKEKTVYHQVSNYLKSKNKNSKVFIIHRLDKDTAGILILAKNIKVKKFYQDNWNKVALKREYMALVNGHLKRKENTIIEYLKENNKIVNITNEKLGKKAITKYTVIKEYKDKSLVKINIETGRKHQIRVAFKNLGNPIIGDEKYGKTKGKLCLKATKLVIKTIDNKVLTLKAIKPDF